MTNAVKFTKKGLIVVTASLKTRSSVDGGLFLSVTVTDSGIGIPPNETDLIFEEGYESSNPESRSLNPYGNGIGLSFCKQVCQSLDGSIKVKSQLGVGSEFTFTIKV